MKSVNRHVIIGNLGSTPELRHTSRGQAVTNFTVATTNSYRDHEGELCESTDWHKVVVWGSRAEACVRFLSKGSRVYVEGRVETKIRMVGDVKVPNTQIVAQDIVFLSYKKEEDNAEVVDFDE